MSLRVLGRALLAASLAATAAAADRLLEGDLVRVDLGRKILVVRPSPGAVELDVNVDAATVFSASGRILALEQMKTGERVVVACADEDAASCRALRVRAGPARHAAPPSPAR
jgi:hypothetical protein